MTALLKAHCLTRDYLIDLSDAGPLPADRVAALCHRHVGVGAEGYMHAARSEGDIRVTCLSDAGHEIDPAGTDLLALAACLNVQGPVTLTTRSGSVAVAPDARGFRMALGPAIFPAGDTGVRDGFDCAVTVAGLSQQRPALSVTIGSPHVVIALPDDGELAEVAWLRAGDVEIDPAPRAGASSALVVPAGTSGTLGGAELRVVDQSRGEVAGSIYAAAAAASALRTWAGAVAPSAWEIRQAGGTVGVELDGDDVQVVAAAEIIADVSPR